MEFRLRTAPFILVMNSVGKGCRISKMFVQIVTLKFSLKGEKSIFFFLIITTISNLVVRVGTHKKDEKRRRVVENLAGWTQTKVFAQHLARFNFGTKHASLEEICRATGIGFSYNHIIQ